MALLDFLPVAGSFLSGIFGMGQQHQANEANMELAQYQFEKNKEMWDLQNKYNSPEQQMERLRSAGLNPNLVYGNGAVGNTTGSAPQYDRPQIQPLSDGSFVSDAVQRGIFTQAQLENLKQQTELSRTQQSVQEANIARINQDVAESVIRSSRNKFDLDLARELRNNSIDVANANLEKIRTSTVGQQIMNDYNKARTSLIPLQKKLTETQIDQLSTAVAQAKWDLQNEYAGRIPKGQSLRDWFINQTIRGHQGMHSIFDDLKKNGVSIDSLWELLKSIF